MSARVVITSIGVMGPTASDFPSFVSSLQEGVAGGGEVTLFDASAFPTRIAAEVPDFDPEAVFEDLRRRNPAVTSDIVPWQDRKTALGLAAAFQCAERSGITDWSGRKVGLHLGTGLSSVTAEQLDIEVCPFLRDDGSFDTRAYGLALEQLQSPSPWRHITDEANRLILAGLHASGPSTSNFSACAASAQAIGRAYLDIRNGRIGRAIAGGMDSMIHPFGMISFMRLGALTTRNESPRTASRPFDKHRDGFLLGEGAAMLLLEELSAARARGATILGEIVGFGTSIDAYMITAPHPDGKGARLAMKRALDDARVKASQIDYINAHGTGTPLNDSTESAALKGLWEEAGALMPPVSSTKGMTGHLIAAAGAIEAVACTAALDRGFIPPSINVETLDPECDVPVVIATKGTAADLRLVMSNSFGFGGQNASLIFKRWQEE